MQNLVKLILDKQGRQLLRFQRRNILEFGGSASDTTDTEEELLQMQSLAGNEKFVGLLSGWTAKRPLEKKLILGIMHKKCHKDFKEENVVRNAMATLDNSEACTT